MRTLGAVLAGGRAHRFGSDKALAEWRGRPLIDHAIDALAGHVAAVAVCGRAYRELPAPADRPGPDLGPLAAINAALHHAGAAGFDRVLTLPCDIPAIAPALLCRLLAHEGAAFYAAVPVIGIWPVGLADALDRRLAGPDRSIRGFASGVGATPLTLAAQDVPTNVNRREDLVALGE